MAFVIILAMSTEENIVAISTTYSLVTIVAACEVVPQHNYRYCSKRRLQQESICVEFVDSVLCINLFHPCYLLFISSHRNRCVADPDMLRTVTYKTDGAGHDDDINRKSFSSLGSFP